MPIMLELFIKLTLIVFIGIMLVSFIGWAFWKVIIACGIAGVALLILKLLGKLG